MYRKSFFVLLGSAITALGVVLLMLSDAGADPQSTLALGIHSHLKIGLGFSSMLFNIVLLVGIYFVDRSYLGWGSLINALAVGAFIQWFLQMPLFARPWFPIWINLIVTPILIGLGIAICVFQDFGAGPFDALMLFITDFFDVPLNAVRVALDAVLVIIGTLLGAPIGFGTLCSVVLIGISIDLWLKAFRFISAWVSHRFFAN